MSTDLSPSSTQIEAEVRIDASAEAVWAALTEEVGQWWPHTFSDQPFRIALEPEIGGRFYEQFDATGAGALYGHVTYIEPGRTLRVSGPMGMRGAVLYVKTYRLEPTDGGTVLRTTASLLGAISEETREGYRAGGEEVLRALKAHVEGAGVSVP